MTKEQVSQRILQNGVPLSMDKFEWNEDTKTFTTEESRLVVDFSGINNCTFITGDKCNFNTGSDCSFETGSRCNFNTGSHCTFNTGFACTFDTATACIFNTGFGCFFYNPNS